MLVSGTPWCLVEPNVSILYLRHLRLTLTQNNIDFHGVPPNEMEYKLAMKELDTVQKALEASL